MWWLEVLVVCAVLGQSVAVDWDTVTLLDEFVNRPDSTYNWTHTSTYDVYDGVTVYILNMTSQTWMSDQYADPSIWWHDVAIAVPDSASIKDAFFMLISLGNNEPDDTPGPGDSRIGRIVTFANETGAVAVYLRQIPNQPVFFETDDDGDAPHLEDFIIGHTFRNYLDQNATISMYNTTDLVLLLPMVKAAKKAVDCVHEFTKTLNKDFNIQKVMPTGWSKRGWTSWLLAAVDKRVFATAPTVFDLLNFIPNLEHHYQAYGNWSWAFFPYWSEAVPRHLIDPRARLMSKNIDAIEYNERLTMPKLITVATGDQFFLLDGSHYFFERLASSDRGPKYMSVCENTDHGTGVYNDVIYRNLQAFFMASYDQSFEWPKMTFKREENSTSGAITLTTDQTPVEIVAHWADTTNETKLRRDFRAQVVDTEFPDLKENPVLWQQQDVTRINDNTFKFSMDKRPDYGWRGFFIEAWYRAPGGRRFRFTTEVNIIPDVLPYPMCTSPEQCQADIV